jgi:hypothetical protein
MSDQNYSDPERDESQSNSPPPPPVPPNQAHLPDHDEEPADDRIQVNVNMPPRSWAVDWLPIGINAVLAVIGIFAISIYGGQLGEMKSTNGLQTKVAQTIYGPDIELTKWMGVYLDKTKDLSARVMVQDNGQTYADSLEIAVRVEIRNSPPNSYRFSPSEFRFMTPRKLRPTRLAIDERYGESIDRSQYSTPPSTPVIYESESKVYVWGEVRYLDFLGSKGDLTFCRDVSVKDVLEAKGNYGNKYENCDEKYLTTPN